MQLDGQQMELPQFRQENLPNGYIPSKTCFVAYISDKIPLLQSSKLSHRPIPINAYHASLLKRGFSPYLVMQALFRQPIWYPVRTHWFQKNRPARRRAFSFPVLVVAQDSLCYSPTPASHYVTSVCMRFLVIASVQSRHYVVLASVPSVCFFHALKTFSYYWRQVTFLRNSYFS